MFNKKKKILLTGASGMLGGNFSLVCPKDYELIGVSRTPPRNPESWAQFLSLDLNNFDKLKEEYLKYLPDVILHTAAMTDVDKCEKYPEEAHNLHVLVTEKLVDLAKSNGAYFIYISSDICYDSAPGVLAKETDRTVISNNYMATKIQGEEVALRYEKSLILRTNIFGYRSHGHQSFGEWVLEGLKLQKELTMFSDVFITPISTFDLSEIILACIKNEISGLFNVGCTPPISKYEFAKLTGSFLGLKTENLIPIKLKEKALLAKRPNNLAMDFNKIENALKIKMPLIENSIQRWLSMYKGI